MPRPLQSPHMPWGLLKEKAWGVSSWNDLAAQAACSENGWSTAACSAVCWIEAIS
ncbi:MAG: hypothetical protein R3E53_00880 [Myxococcota bacterium]